jgi:hypothetical protein
MSEQARPIFRAEVYERFVKARREPVWPRWIAPPTVRVLWVLLAIAIVASALAWRTRVPLFAETTAVFVRDGARGAWLVLAPVELDAPAGASVFLAEPANVRIALDAVESGASSPAEICRRFALEGAAAAAVVAPARVALAHEPSASPASDARIGTVCKARIRTGEVAALHFLPVVGPWLAPR